MIGRLSVGGGRGGAWFNRGCFQVTLSGRSLEGTVRPIPFGYLMFRRCPECYLRPRALPWFEPCHSLCLHCLYQGKPASGVGIGLTPDAALTRMVGCKRKRGSPAPEDGKSRGGDIGSAKEGKAYPGTIPAPPGTAPGPRDFLQEVPVLPSRGTRSLDRLPFHPNVTFLIGENGAGKSTLLEALALSVHLNPEGVAETSTSLPGRPTLTLRNASACPGP